MSLIDTIMGMFGKKKGSVPGMDTVGQVGDLKEKAGDMLEQHAETLEKVTDAIPGQADDKLVEKAKDVLQ